MKLNKKFFQRLRGHLLQRLGILYSLGGWGWGGGGGRGIIFGLFTWTDWACIRRGPGRAGGPTGAAGPVRPHDRVPDDRGRQRSGRISAQFY